MKTIVLLLVVGCLIATASVAQGQSESRSDPTGGGRGAEAPQPTPFEGFVKRPGTRITSSVEVARIEAGDAVAVFTALKVQDSAGGAALGIRINLSRPGARDEVHLGTDEIPVMNKGVNAIINGLPGFLERAAGRAAAVGYFGAAEFWMPKLQLLNVAYYGRAEETGVALGAFGGGNGYYHFPGRTPLDVRQALDKAAGALGLPKTAAPAGH